MIIWEKIIATKGGSNKKKKNHGRQPIEKCAEDVSRHWLWGTFHFSEEIIGRSGIHDFKFAWLKTPAGVPFRKVSQLEFRCVFTTSQVVRVSGRIPRSTAQGLCAEYACHLVIGLGNCTLLASGRKIDLLLGDSPPCWALSSYSSTMSQPPCHKVSQD